MKSKKFPTERQIKKALVKLEKQEGSIALPSNADAIVKTKFEICEQFIKYIYKNKITQTELASLLGISKARVSEICNYRVERYTIDKLLDYYTRINPKIGKMKLAA